MFLLIANAIVLLTAIVIARFVQSRLRAVQKTADQIQQAQAALRELNRQLEAQRVSLQALVVAAQQAAKQLPTAEEGVNPDDWRQPLDNLARIEALADSEALADEQALERVAGNLESISAGDFESL